MPEVTEQIEPTDQDAFNSGFNDAPTETPATTNEPEVEAPIAEEPPEPKTKVLLEDEYQTLLESAAQVSAMKAANDKQFGTAFGKLGGIERTLQQLQNTPTGQVPEVTDEDMADLRDYGDELPATLKNALNKALSKVKVGGSAPIDEAALEPIVQRRVSEALDIAKKERQDEAEETVAEAHADFKQVFAEPGFATWRESLPEERRTKLENSWNPAVISKAITDYKAVKAKQSVKPEPKPNDRRELLEASITPRGTAVVAPNKKTEQQEFMSGSGFIS